MKKFIITIITMMLCLVSSAQIKTFVASSAKMLDVTEYGTNVRKSSNDKTYIMLDVEHDILTCSGQITAQYYIQEVKTERTTDYLLTRMLATDKVDNTIVITFYMIEGREANLIFRISIYYPEHQFAYDLNLL